MHSLHGVCVFGGGGTDRVTHSSLISYIRSRGGWREEGLTSLPEGPLGKGTGHGPTLGLQWQGWGFFPSGRETLDGISLQTGVI